MSALNQTPLFQLTPEETALDTALAERGYTVIDPVILYATPAVDLAQTPPKKGVRAVRVRTRLAVIDEVWDAGGVGPARRAVMARTPGPKSILMARTDMRVGGAAFVAVAGDIAMIHAIEVRPDQRRMGAGAAMIAEAARFALDHGAAILALAVTRANSPARALYVGLGMTEAASYHYRILP